MSRLAATFECLKAQNEAALIIYITAGDPFPSRTAEVVQAIANAGADIVEIGIPFSDPLADGPVIQASSLRALQAGVTPPDVLLDVKKIRALGVTIPIVLMGSWNPILQYGPGRFASDAASAGVDATIVTDLSPDEADEWKHACNTSKIDTIFLLAPTSTQRRMQTVSPLAGGFIYCVSRNGITGLQDEVAANVSDLVANIRSNVPGVPICVGFGISLPEHVAQISQIADGAVVGSRIVSTLHETRDLTTLGNLVRELKAATRR